MKQLNSIFQHLLMIFRAGKNQVEAYDISSRSAAVPSQTETEELHRGKRRLKENYTSHWDLDYIRREEREALMKEKPDRKVR